MCFFLQFLCDFFDAFLQLFCDFFTLLKPLFGANRRTFVELFWHAFSRFARARAFRQQRTTRTGQFWKPRAHAPSDSILMCLFIVLGFLFPSFLCHFLGSLLLLFCDLSFFVDVLSRFFRYFFLLLGCFLHAF